MIIEIESFGNELNFYFKSRKIFHSYYKVSWFKNIKELKDIKNDVVSKLSSKVNFSGIKHIITFKNNVKLELKLKGGLVKNYYECFYKNDNYRIVVHKGYKTSIFRNKNQIAFYDKKPTTVLETYKILLICNSNINKELIFSFISALELSSDQKEGIEFDLGNLTIDYLPFDEKWIAIN